MNKRMTNLTVSRLLIFGIVALFLSAMFVFRLSNQSMFVRAKTEFDDIIACQENRAFYFANQELFGRAWEIHSCNETCTSNDDCQPKGHCYNKFTDGQARCLYASRQIMGQIEKNVEIPLCTPTPVFGTMRISTISIKDEAEYCLKAENNQIVDDKNSPVEKKELIKKRGGKHTKSYGENLNICEKLRVYGNPEKKYDILILPHGYQDLNLFRADAQRMLKEQFYATNLSTLENEVLHKINFWISKNLTQDYNLELKKEEYFGVGEYNFPYWSKQIVDEIGRNCYPKGMETYIILSKTISYTDLGGIVATYNPISEGIFIPSFALDFNYILAHELFHRFGGGDEYSYNKIYEGENVPASPNCSRFAKCNWQGECLPVCGFSNWYKAAKNSVMQNANNANGNFTQPALDAWREALSPYQ